MRKNDKKPPDPDKKPEPEQPPEPENNGEPDAPDDGLRDENLRDVFFPKGEPKAEAPAASLEEQFLPKPTVEDLQVETLSGDIRDFLLTHVRMIKVPWAMLNEDEQRNLIEAYSKASMDLVRKTLAVISASKFPVIGVAIGKFTVDKGVKIECTDAPTVENITHLAQHGKGSGVLVLAEARDYFGERAPARADKNQKELPLDPPKD